MKIKQILFIGLLLFSRATIAHDTFPQLFLFLGGNNASSYKHVLKNNCINGVQIIYSWRQLEPQKDIYDFSKIEKDLKFLAKEHKKLFIQIQDRSLENLCGAPRKCASVNSSILKISSEF